MKKIIIILLAVLYYTTVTCQNEKSFTDYFPVIKNDSIISSVLLQKQYFKIVDINAFPDDVSLKYFFNNNKEKMQGEFEGYNADHNTYTYTTYTKKVYPLYVKKFNNTYIICYGLQSIVYLSFYNCATDKIENTFVVADFDDDPVDTYIHSIIFSNNYIAIIQVAEKSYYIFYKIDYENRKFMELKRVKFDSSQSDYEIKNNIFDALGISEEGELLEENEPGQETENKLIEK
ncbi:MAG: hypothetical protein LBD59_01040 [Prevotellaceae bacterium]|jgi:hypothetical protein|nr:hypothetical protein [Prevotellaceae bacterium]